MNKKGVLLFFCLTLPMICLFFLFNRTAQSNELNVFEKIAEGQTFNYMIIGDSIGRGSGAENKNLRWFVQLEDLIEKKYHSKGRSHLIVQSGATAFEGINKLQSHTIQRNMDMIFIVFGENDRKYMNEDEFSFFYHKLLYDVKKRYPNAEIITLIESSLRQEPFAQAIKDVSSDYSAKNLDMRIPFNHSGLSNEKLTKDLVHPNGDGYKLYASTIFDLINQNINRKVNTKEWHNTRTNVEFIFEENKVVTKNDGFQLQNGVYSTNTGHSSLEFEFTGPVLGAHLIRSVDGGMIRVFVDGEYIRTISTWWPFTRDRYIYISSALENTKHVVKFEMSDQVSVNNLSEKPIVQLISVVQMNEN